MGGEIVVYLKQKETTKSMTFFIGYNYALK